MKTISFLAALFIAIIVSTACVPSAAPEAAQQPIVELPAGQTLETDVLQEPASPVSTVSAADTPPMAVATTRGDQLVATDPLTVNLSGGVPTLVEFFRFT